MRPSIWNSPSLGDFLDPLLVVWRYPRCSQLAARRPVGERPPPEAVDRSRDRERLGGPGRPRGGQQSGRERGAGRTRVRGELG